MWGRNQLNLRWKVATWNTFSTSVSTGRCGARDWRDPAPGRPRPQVGPAPRAVRRHPRLTRLAGLAVVLQLHAGGAGAGVERLPGGQQAQVGAAPIVLLALRVDCGTQGRLEKVPEQGPRPSPTTCSQTSSTPPPRILVPWEPQCVPPPRHRPGVGILPPSLVSFGAPRRTPPP